jgi:hypothetical protein
MSTKKSDDQQPQGKMLAEDRNEALAGRRDALKRTITVGGVSIALAGWTKPVVESVVLPAHAQTTGGLLFGIVLNLP